LDFPVRGNEKKRRAITKRYWPEKPPRPRFFLPNGLMRKDGKKRLSLRGGLKFGRSKEY